MRYTQLVFSPTGGVRRAAGLLSAAISDRFETIDLSLTLNGQKSARFSKEDVCLIAVPCFGGRVPEIALTYQTVRRFYGWFGEKVSVLNSRLSPRETLRPVQKSQAR